MSDLPFAAAVGQRLRAVRDRAGVTADQVAQVAQQCGFGWQRSTVASIETGRRGLSAEELIALPLILTWATGADVTLWDLAGAGGVLADDLSVTQVGIAQLMQRERLTTGGWKRPRTAGRNRETFALVSGVTDATTARSSTEVDLIRRLWPEMNGAMNGEHWWPDLEQLWSVRHAAVAEAEQKAARGLGVSSVAVSACAHRLWGHGLTDERDRRDKLLDEASRGSDDAAARTRRGHITRALLADLRAVLREDTTSDGQR